MHTDDMLRGEVQRLYALEGGLVSVFDQLDGRVRSRKAAVSITMLIDAADRHLMDLERVCAKEGWVTSDCEPPLVQAWRMEVEKRVLDVPSGAATDAVCLSLLRRAVHFRIPCYETARLFALYAERPLIARTLSLALEDEHQSLERLSRASELGVSLQAALGSRPFMAS